MNQSETEALREKLNRLTAEFEDFTYIVSHDFKAPLRAISSLSDWIAEDLGTDLQPDVAESLRLLQSRVARLEQMLEAILAMSRVPRFDLDAVDTDVAELVHEVASRLDVSEAFAVEVKGNARLTTYRKKLGQTLELLLHNAARFCNRPDGKATIAIEDSGDALLLTVTDNGPGVAEHIRNKMFSIYSTTLTDIEPPATGKGLALAKRIVEFVGGNIQYKPDQGTGATFCIQWPKALNIAADVSK